MIGRYGPWKTKWDQSGIKSKNKKKDETDLLNCWESWMKDTLIDPSCPGQNQPDRQEERIVAGLRQGQRSPRVTLFMLRQPTASAWPVSSEGSSEGWWLFTQSDWRSGINESHRLMDDRLCVCRVSVCLDPRMECAFSHYLYSSPCSCLLLYFFLKSWY